MTYQQETGILAQIWLAVGVGTGNKWCGIMGILFFACKFLPERITWSSARETKTE